MEKTNKAKLRSGDRCILGEWSYDVEIEHHVAMSLPYRS